MKSTMVLVLLFGIYFIVLVWAEPGIGVHLDIIILYIGSFLNSFQVYPGFCKTYFFIFGFHIIDIYIHINIYYTNSRYIKSTQKTRHPSKHEKMKQCCFSVSLFCRGMHASCWLGYRHYTNAGSSFRVTCHGLFCALLKHHKRNTHFQSKVFHNLCIKLILIMSKK